MYYGCTALQSTTVQCRSVQCKVCTTVQCKSASTCLAAVYCHTALDELFHKPKIGNLEWEKSTTSIESPPHSTNLVKLLGQFIPIANWSSLSISGERYIWLAGYNLFNQLDDVWEQSGEMNAQKLELQLLSAFSQQMHSPPLLRYVAALQCKCNTTAAAIRCHCNTMHCTVELQKVRNAEEQFWAPTCRPGHY